MALTGCGQRTPHASHTGTKARSPDSSATVQGEPVAPLADNAFVALGNEPFWYVRITAHEILYKDPEHQEGFRFPGVAAVEEGGTRVFRTRREIPAGEPGP